MADFLERVCRVRTVVGNPRKQTCQWLRSDEAQGNDWGLDTILNSIYLLFYYFK